MNLQMVGCSHHDCPLELREQLSFRPEEVTLALARFRQRFPGTEAVLLSTCNRTEIYTGTTDVVSSPTRADIARFFADVQGLDGETLFEELFARTGEEAIRHLFTVASSLHSMVVGEAQILSQVKEAYQRATELKSTGQITHSAFQAAIRVAKRIASETTIHHGRVSIPSVAIGDFAKRIFERLDDKSVLVIGAGAMGEETLRYLVQAKAQQISVVNRNSAKARELADRYGGQSVSWEYLLQPLISADIVVATTASKDPVITLENYRQIEADRLQRPLLIIDLAVPRDVDPDVGNCRGVYLYSIDDLKRVVCDNQEKRQKQWPRAKKIIEDETKRFMEDLDHRATGPTIRRLKDTAAKIKSAELQRLLNKLAGLNQQDQSEIVQSFDRLVNKLLHPPLESLRDEKMGEKRRGLLKAVRKLFQLEE